MFELLFDLFAWPCFAVLEAVAALLWPSENPTVRRLQRICLVTLLAAVATAGGAAVLAYVYPGRYAIALFVVAGVLLIGSGLLGNRIERICRDARLRGDWQGK